MDKNKNTFLFFKVKIIFLSPLYETLNLNKFPITQPAKKVRIPLTIVIFVLNERSYSHTNELREKMAPLKKKDKVKITEGAMISFLL